MPIPVPKCDKCESAMILKQKGPDKFWGCPNYARCGGKTKSYAGVDRPSESTDPSITETLARIELKMDFILDNLKSNESKIVPVKLPFPTMGVQLKEVIQKRRDEDEEQEELEPNEINPKDIPF